MHTLFKGLNTLNEYGPDPYLHFPIQLAENAERILVRTLAPGMKQKDLEIILIGKKLSITGRIACKSGRYLRQECPCGSFRRDVGLSCRIDAAQASADLKDGVLTIVLPKHKRSSPYRVQVKYGG